MSGLLFILLVSVTTFPFIASGQTQNAESKGRMDAAVVRGEAQQDCACESQVLPDDLAVVNGVRITRKDIEDRTREPVDRLQRQIIEARKRELDLEINSKLADLEAKRRSISVTRLLEEEVVAKVVEPTSAEVRAYYNTHKDRIKIEFKDATNGILQLLRNQRQHEQAKKFAERLRIAIETKVLVHEATPPKQPSDRERVFATVAGQPITSADVEKSLHSIIRSVQEEVYRLRRTELDLRINDILLEQEAQRRKTTTNSVLDAEIKPKSITEEDARKFYEQNKDRVSGEFSETKDHIIRYLQQNELRSAELEFVERLRAAASIQIFLISPNVSVANTASDDSQKRVTTK